MHINRETYLLIIPDILMCCSYVKHGLGNFANFIYNMNIFIFSFGF